MSRIQVLLVCFKVRGNLVGQLGRLFLPSEFGRSSVIPLTFMTSIFHRTRPLQSSTLQETLHKGSMLGHCKAKGEWDPGLATEVFDHAQSVVRACITPTLRGSYTLLCFYRTHRNFVDSSIPIPIAFQSPTPVTTPPLRPSLLAETVPPPPRTTD